MMMILRILLVLLPFLSMGSQLQAGWWDNIKSSLGFKEKPTPPKIRVLVVHDVEGVQLEVRGMYSLFDPYTNSYMSTRYTGKSRYIQAFSGGLKWGEAFPGLYQLKIRPDEPQTITMIDGKPYRGVLYVYDIGGSISIVNEVPIEEQMLISKLLIPKTPIGL
jgi:stage II sporulation protein D